MASAVCSVSGLRKISNNNNGSNSSGGPDAVYNQVIIILIVNTIIIKMKTILMTNITMIITITAIARGRISMEHQLPLLLPRAEGERFALSPFAGLLQLFFPFFVDLLQPLSLFLRWLLQPFFIGFAHCSTRSQPGSKGWKPVQRRRRGHREIHWRWRRRLCGQCQISRWAGWSKNKTYQLNWVLSMQGPIESGVGGLPRRKLPWPRSCRWQ